MRIVFTKIQKKYFTLLELMKDKNQSNMARKRREKHRSKSLEQKNKADIYKLRKQLESLNK